MNLQKILVPVLGVVIVAAGWRAYGWGGVALASGGILMWVLLHFNRAMQVLKRAGDRPVGYVDSAVMLNARLRPNLTLLHVIGLARSLPEHLSPKDQQPEVFRWTDGSGSHVTCEFAGGRLASWVLERPQQPTDEPAGEAPPGR